jgi:glutamate--cysteine ligase
MDIPVPHLITAHTGPLYPVEEALLSQVAAIEAWFRTRWQETPAPITTSVDLRHAGFKLAPVDTNLFPAGFNNLNPDFLPLCVQAVQTVIESNDLYCTKIIILPESHTRNRFYLQSLSRLRNIFIKAGFIVRIGSLDPDVQQPVDLTLENGEVLRIEPIEKVEGRICIKNFDPCLIVLNNDLSSGIPEIFTDVQQNIIPSPKLGWSTRLKSTHFTHYAEAAAEFANLVNLDPWLINPLFRAVDGIDFMAQEGLQTLADTADELLEQIRSHYVDFQIKDTPFIAIKADNGTYGMSVMMVQEGKELLQLNRKQRTKMAASKGSQKVSRVILQEGVYTFETMPNGAVAEPVVYMIGPHVVGGFYRVHQGRGITENLNAPGMQFEPLAFAQACNMPCEDRAALDCPNRFYAYGVIARLAALAAAREAAAVVEQKAVS